MIREGIVGDREADGWVAWTTSDDDWSWNPAIACGGFLIVFGHGVEWGASDDRHGVATIVDIEESAEAMSEYSFPWCMAGAERAVADIAERCGHPAVDNVVAAARELWFALMQEGVADV